MSERSELRFPAMLVVGDTHFRDFTVYEVRSMKEAVETALRHFMRNDVRPVVSETGEILGRYDENGALVDLRSDKDWNFTNVAGAVGCLPGSRDLDVEVGEESLCFLRTPTRTEPVRLPEAVAAS